MGLYVSHDCWRGAYSAFGRWRNQLAVAAGYTLKTTSRNPAWPEFTITYPDLPEEMFSKERLAGNWEECPDDPILILLSHYDDEGIIKHEHTVALAERLESLLPILREGERNQWEDPFTRTKAFIAGLYRAWEACEDVEFS